MQNCNCIYFFLQESVNSVSNNSSMQRIPGPLKPTLRASKEVRRSLTEGSIPLPSNIHVKTSPLPQKNNRSNKERQKKEDHLSTIFMGYVLVFLVCHTPRLFLSIYELREIRRALECAR